MVEPIVHGLFASLAAWLRVHELGVRRSLILSHLLPNFLVTLVLTLQEGLLVGKELLLRAWLLTVLTIGCWLESCQLGVFLRHGLPLAHLLEFLDACLLPSIEPLDVLHRILLVLHLFLGKVKGL